MIRVQGLTKAQAKSAVEAVFKAVAEAAAAGEETSIPGFGKFKVKETAEREGRNPATGETVTIAAAKKAAHACQGIEGCVEGLSSGLTALPVPTANCRRVGGVAP